jgi:general secretion pathway protein D
MMGRTTRKGALKIERAFRLAALVCCVLMGGCAAWKAPAVAEPEGKSGRVAAERPVSARIPADVAPGGDRAAASSREGASPIKAGQELGRPSAAAPSGGVPERRVVAGSGPVRESPALPGVARPGVEERVRTRTPGEAETRTELELSFDNADIYEVLDATLFQTFGANFVVDPAVRAKVTFHVKGAYTRSEFIDALNQVLQLSGLAVVEGPGRLYKVVRKQVGPAVQGPLWDADGAVSESGDVTQIIRLRYLSAAAAAKSVKSFCSPGAVLVPDDATNSLVITDTRQNVDNVLRILSVMDVDQVRDVSWRIFPVHYGEASDVAEDLRAVLTAKGLYQRPGMDPGGLQVHAVKSLNAVLVATRWPSVLELAARWIDVMDQPGQGGEGVYVYVVENGSAEDLAEILTQLYGRSAASSRRQGEAVRRPTVVEAVREEGSEQPPPPPQMEAAAGELTGEVAFISDPATNSLLIRANERDYQSILKVIRKLDIMPRQVLINVIIAEISLSGSIEYGLEWFLQGHWDDYTGQAILDGGVARSVDTALGSGTGFTMAVFDGVDFLRGLIKALGKDSRLNILSSPNVMASDHQEASIEVAEEVPIVTGEVTSQEATAVTRTIQYRKTGIILKVTPHINSTGLVKLEISQEVSQKGERDEELKTTSILNRSVNSTIVVQDGQTIIIGGLIRDTDSDSRSGIPVLRDIPILGYAFGGRTTESTKAELILLITPRVVKDRQQADAITREFSSKVARIQEMLKRRNDGGQDVPLDSSR